ncbi:hypothetical protein D3C87_1618560 [compost metagenome]
MTPRKAWRPKSVGRGHCPRVSPIHSASQRAAPRKRTNTTWKVVSSAPSALATASMQHIRAMPAALRKRPLVRDDIGEHSWGWVSADDRVGQWA